MRLRAWRCTLRTNQKPNGRLVVQDGISAFEGGVVAIEYENTPDPSKRILATRVMRWLRCHCDVQVSYSILRKSATEPGITELNELQKALSDLAFPYERITVKLHAPTILHVQMAEVELAVTVDATAFEKTVLVSIKMARVRPELGMLRILLSTTEIRFNHEAIRAAWDAATESWVGDPTDYEFYRTPVRKHIESEKQRYAI